MKLVLECDYSNSASRVMMKIIGTTRDIYADHKRNKRHLPRLLRLQQCCIIKLRKHG